MTLEEERLACDLQEIGLFGSLAAWNAPWQKAWLSIAMLESRWPAADIESKVSEHVAKLRELPTITFPNPGWLQDLLNKTKPDFMESAFLVTEILHMGDGLAEGMRFATKTIKPSEMENRALVEPLYREAIATFSGFVPEGLEPGQSGLWLSQREILIQTLKMTLSAHLLLSGRKEESAQLYPAFSSGNVMTGLSDTVEKVVGNVSNQVAFIQRDLPSDAHESMTFPGKETENDRNPKHLIYTANTDFLYHKSQSLILKRYRSGLELLGLSGTDAQDLSGKKLEAAARRFIETPYSVPILGGLFYAADNIIALKDFDLAYAYLMLDGKIREIENEPQFGFSKYLTEFVHSNTLAKVLTQLGQIEEALKVLQEWATSAQSYESPQDVSGRTLGTLLVSRVLARYAMLLTLNGNKADASKWWQKVLARSESLQVICELCADRLGLGDSSTVATMLSFLNDRELTNENTNDLIFYWWILKQVKDSRADLPYKIASANPDWLNSLANFISTELLSQRYDCSVAESLTKIIEDAQSHASELEIAPIQYDLIGIYLRQALLNQQRDQIEESEACYQKGLLVLDALAGLSLEADPKKALKLAYLQSEFVRDYGLFLEQHNRESEVVSLRTRYLLT